MAKKKKKSNQLVSLAHMVQDMAERIVPELGELRDPHVKALTFFAREVARLERFRLMVDTKPSPKTITIVALDPTGQPVRFRLKNQRLLDDLPAFLQLPDYIVKFYQGDEIG